MQAVSGVGYRGRPNGFRELRFKHFMALSLAVEKMVPRTPMQHFFASTPEVDKTGLRSFYLAFSCIAYRSRQIAFQELRFKDFSAWAREVDKTGSRSSDLGSSLERKSGAVALEG